MLRSLHPLAGILALGLIALFWLSSVLAEFSGSRPAILAVKTLILIGVAFLVPLLITAALTGNRMAGRRQSPEIAAKRARMKAMAAGGILILVPAAIFLWLKARSGEFDAWFYTVQAVELLAGAVNLALGSMNARAGLAMRLARAKPAREA